MRDTRYSKILVKNLRLRTYIGFNREEKINKQDIIINYSFFLDLEKAAFSDLVEDTVDYKKINKKIIRFVEEGKFNLLERLARGILRIILSTSGVVSACVEVDKPFALRFADSVAVSMSGEKREKKRVHSGIISIGSNIKPNKHIAEAINFIEKKFTIVNKTAFLQTKPVGYADQEDFINGAVKIETNDVLMSVQKTLKSIEKELKRKRDPKNPNGPRTIDLDLVTWDGEIIDNDVREKVFLTKFAQELSPEIVF